MKYASSMVRSRGERGEGGGRNIHLGRIMFQERLSLPRSCENWGQPTARVTRWKISPVRFKLKLGLAVSFRKFQLRYVQLEFGKCLVPSEQEKKKKKGKESAESVDVNFY